MDALDMSQPVADELSPRAVQSKKLLQQVEMHVACDAVAVDRLIPDLLVQLQLSDF